MSTELSEVARGAVLHQLASAHDHWSEEEQRLKGGKVRAVNGFPLITSERAHDYALICLRAYRAELDEPEPQAVLS